MIIDMFDTPGGRLKEDGPYSAEEFVELVKPGDIVNLDTAFGICDSFLSEFARRLPEDVLFMSKDKKLIEKIYEYRNE